MSDMTTTTKPPQPPRPRITIGGWFAIIMLVAALAAGGIYWNWKADQNRVSHESSCLFSPDC